MKTNYLLLALVALGAAFPTANARTEENMNNLSFRRYQEPLFPNVLKVDGITAGFVEILVDINEDGSIADWLPVRASHPQFLRSIEYAIDEWAFDPPVIDGKPAPVVQRFTFNFSHEGIVLISGNLTEVFLNRLTRDHQLYNFVVSMKELDQIPEPIAIVRPLINPDIPLEERQGTVVVQFFIDREGKVRIPVVKQMAAHRGLAQAAFAAIQQWKFKPPTVHGQPVVVEVQQAFHFKDPIDQQTQVRD